MSYEGSTAGAEGQELKRAYGTFQKAWGIFAPTVMLIYIIPVFLINLLLWIVLFSLALPRQLLRVRFIPILLLGLGVGFLIIQANQNAIVEVLDVATECFDQLYAFFGKAVFDDVIITIYPVCTLFSYFVEVIKYTIRGVTNEYRCYFSCDNEFCACETCGGGQQCNCQQCGVDPGCNCDGPTFGFPTAGGFAVFLDGEGCICFQTAFRELLGQAGVPPTEIVQIISDLIDFLDIAPSTNPILFQDFVANFPQPGDVDWIYSDTLSRDIKQELINKNLRVISKRNQGLYQSNVVPGFAWSNFHEMGKVNENPVLLERYINMSSEGYTHQKIVRQIPDPILDILCAGKTPFVDCPEPDPQTGYNYPIFKLIANEFFGPFIEIFSEVVLWLFNFLAYIFEITYDQFLGDLLNTIINGSGPSSSDFLELVVQGFQTFTQEFLCQLVGWSIPGPFNDAPNCCRLINFSNPYEFLLSILTLPECLFGLDIGFIEECLTDFDAFEDCVLRFVPDPTRTVTDSATNAANAAANAVSSAAGGRTTNFTKKYYGGSGYSPLGNESITLTGNMKSFAFGGSHGESEGSIGGSKSAYVSGQGCAPPPHVLSKTFILDCGKKEKSIKTVHKEYISAGPSNTVFNENAMAIFKNPLWRSIHETILGKSMKEIYPHLNDQFERYERAYPKPLISKNSGMWDRMMDDLYGSSRKTIMDKIVERVNVLKTFGSFSTKMISKTIDTAGMILFDSIDEYVSKVGVGEPAIFNKKALDISTIRHMRKYAMSVRHKRSNFDHQHHLDILDAQEKLYWKEQTMEHEFETQGRDSPLAGLTHGQKALRYAAQSVSTIRKMFGYAVWDDDSYDFITPSTSDLMTEIDQRALGSSIVRGFTHFFQFVKQDNRRRETDQGTTMDDRPAFIIQMETALKAMTYRFVSPGSLGGLRDDLCERGPRWCQTAHRVIDPTIRSYEIDRMEKEKRRILREQGDTSVPFQLTDITFGTVLAWSLEHMSFRANSVAHRRELSKAIFEGNETRYVELRMSQLQLKHPINKVRDNNLARNKNLREKYAREFKNIVDKESQLSSKESSTWTSRLLWWRRANDDDNNDNHRKNNGNNNNNNNIGRRQGMATRIPEDGIDPQVKMFFNEHYSRVAKTRGNPQQMMNEYKRTLTRLPQLLVLGKALLPLLKNVRYLFLIAVPVLSSPYAQNVYGFYADFLEDFLGDIISEPIDDLVTSPGFLLDFGEQFSITTLESINYLATELVRTLLCLAPQIVSQLVLSYLSFFAFLIPYVGTVIYLVIGFFNTIGGFFLPLIAVCPAEVIPGEQNPLTYFFDVLDCDSSIQCSSSDDCPGRGPCRCPLPRVTQWLSLFWQINPEPNCQAGQVGYCLCFWEGPCDQAAPEFVLNEAFDDTCDKFGYAIGEDLIPWYPGNPEIFSSVGNFFDYLFDYVESGVVWLQFISKTIARGWEPFIDQSTFIAISGVVVGLALAALAAGVSVRKVFAVFFLIVILVVIAYGGPVYTDFVADSLIPAIQNVGDTFGFLSSITDFLLDFLQFDNASDADPIGSPDPSEFTCFLLNTGTGLITLSVISIGFFALLTLFSLGILADLFQVIWYFLLIIPRTIWRLYEFAIYVYQEEGQQGGGYEGGYGGGADDFGPAGYSTGFYYYGSRGRAGSTMNRRNIAGNESLRTNNNNNDNTITTDSTTSPAPIIDYSQDEIIKYDAEQGDPIYDNLMIDENGNVQNIRLQQYIYGLGPQTVRHLFDNMKGHSGPNWRNFRIGKPISRFYSMRNNNNNNNEKIKKKKNRKQRRVGRHIDYHDHHQYGSDREGIGFEDVLQYAKKLAASRRWNSLEQKINFIQSVIDAYPHERQRVQRSS